MIGILCPKNKKKTYSNKFFELLRYKIESIIVFSITDLDFSDKTVSGNLITQSEIKPMTTPIPDIVYNFLRKRTRRKKIRTLAEQADIILINEVNRFKQHMIMEMLSSSDKTKEFVPSYSIYTNSSDINEILQKGEALILPEAGNDCKTLYTINDIIQNQSCLLSKKKWLVLNIPNILKQKGNLAIFTLHAVRDAKDEWNALPLSKSTLKVRADDALTQILYKSASEIAGCICSFIPSLAFCTIKIVLDENRSPFLANFAGWDSSLLLKKQKPDLLGVFAEHFLGYSNLLLNIKSEKNHVD